MPDIYIRQLTEAEQNTIISGQEYAQTHELIADVAALDEYARTLRATDPESSNLQEALTGLGASLGFHIQRATGMQWAAVTDGSESAIVLVGQAGEQTVVSYPFDVVAQRWHQDVTDTFSNYLSELLSTISAHQSAAESPAAE